ncbi:hypothetical protein HanRHA438_Chr11g0520801 [Helianthus annuus]|nr:hypothetical protein HanRHA438_Chr11g0520801 [Helianthus annuus]
MGHRDLSNWSETSPGQPVAEATSRSLRHGAAGSLPSAKDSSSDSQTFASSGYSDYSYYS